MLKEFRDFVARGNVLDLAVAVIIGAAFATITTSLTDDIIRGTHLSPEERETGFGVAARLAIAAGLTA